MNPQIYTYTGLVQQFTVPAGVTSITIEAIGGGGGQAIYVDGCPGGGAGQVQANFSVNPTDTLKIYIGGKGLAGIGASGGTNSYASGGNGGGVGNGGGSGGAATCVTLNNDLTMLVIAGGGGGGAYTTTPKLLGQGGYGGGNGNANGGNGGNGGGGGGTSAGVGGTGAGGAGSGGYGSNNGLTLGDGGGAGSGYGCGGGGGYGGGGGVYGNGGGGGGSSFVNSTLGTSSFFNYIQSTTLNGGTYGAGGEAPSSQPLGSDGNSGYVSITCHSQPPTPPTPEPIANICFPAGTLIQTDQGPVAIEKIDTDVHTIRQQPILYITRTTTLDRFLVCIQKDALGINCPSADTVMTKDHNILFKGKMVPAYKFLTHSKLVKKVKYSGELLYNVLLRNYSSMLVNNLMCETLHPQNFIAKLYTNCYTDEYNDTIIDIMNYSINNKDYPKYKRIVEQAKYI